LTILANILTSITFLSDLFRYTLFQLELWSGAPSTCFAGKQLQLS
jgi:hypothetical protein